MFDRAAIGIGVAALSAILVASCSDGQPVSEDDHASVSFASSAATAFVRVNQVGYPSSATKRAFVMSSAALTGTPFSVAGSAATFSGSIGPSAGLWSRSFPYVYVVDFTSVSAAGTYTITVAGATSPSFRIDTAANLYAGDIANTLSFYENERDGAHFLPSALRTAAGHLNDSSAMTYLTPAMNNNGHFSGDLTALGASIDASGGWWDAGDYLKFVETESYTTALMQIGVRDFPRQMGSSAPSSNFTAEAKFGTDWLQKMWDDAGSTLYYQVGIGAGNAQTTSDHDIWRLPQADDGYGGTDPKYRYIRNRPVFRAAPPGSPVSPNLAGRLAADLALCFQIHRTDDPAYANACLTRAEHIFEHANTAPTGDLLTVAPFSFYPEVEWRDDLELGAVELYFALAAGGLPSGLLHADPLFYLQKAAHWANAYITGPNDAADTLNLYDVSGLAHYELYRAIAQAGSPRGLEVTQPGLLADIKKQLDKAVATAQADPFGFGFPWAAFDTTTHGAGMSVMASEYDHLTGTKTYDGQSQGWLDNILGANAWGTSLIVGDGTTFPHCMQHQVANLAGSKDGSPPVLAGAAVEGPNSFAATGVVSGMVTCPANGVDVFAPYDGKTAVYGDNVQSWSTVEPAIDLTASSPLAFAWRVVAP